MAERNESQDDGFEDAGQQSSRRSSSMGGASGDESDERGEGGYGGSSGFDNQGTAAPGEGKAGGGAHGSDVARADDTLPDDSADAGGPAGGTGR